VARFPASKTRSDLYDAWRTRRGWLAAILALDVEWVGGSFVTAKVNPTDLDVTTFVAGESWDQLPMDEQKRFAGLIRSKACDGFLVAAYPAGHPAHERYRDLVAMWERHWGHDRDGNAMGFVEVTEAP